MQDFFELKKNLKKDFSGMRVIRLAILGDNSTQLLKQSLRGEGYNHGYDFEIWEADFDQVQQQVFDTGSELYAFSPEIVIIFRSTHKLLDKYDKLNSKKQSLLASNELEIISGLFSQLKTHLNAEIIYYNYYEINATVLGNYSNKTEHSFLFQLRKLNYELMNLAIKNSNIHICDLSAIHNQVGKHYFFNSSMYITSEMVLSLNVLPLVAARTIDIIIALNGKSKKCLILDLDNTIWGGIIGDDGMENIQIGNLGIGKAFTKFQYWIKKLKTRGIIIAVCSKNTYEVAKEPFEKHPDMILHLEDISTFIANWENKADNIRHIQQILNISFDSMVFLDDNPFERNLVRESIPQITVPELPEDPAEYLEYLYDLNLFEAASFSDEDAHRTEFYQRAAQRNNIEQKFSNKDDFLKSLEMTSLVESFNQFNTPRVAQLSQRSNQFNLRTVRYTEEDITRVGSSPDYFAFSFTLEDKFGDNGLIAVVVLQKENIQTLFIENWFMSCRVLKRGMENFMLSAITDFAKENGFRYLKGEYIPTEKNIIVKDHYLNLGFEKSGNYWLFSIDNEIKESFIKIKWSKWKQMKYSSI